MATGSALRFFQELRRRRVLRVVALYIVAAWVVIQVADLALKPWGFPDQALRYIWIGVVLSFPLAVIFGWLYDITPQGIVRTAASDPDKETDFSLQRADYIILSAFLIVVSAITFGLTREILETRSDVGSTITAREISKQSVAVLPFENLSREEANEPFTAGIHDDIISQISKIGSLKVISRTSVLRYRNTTKTAREISQELGVSTILEGGVQRAGRRVRINVQLIDAETDAHLWAETFDRELTTENIFAIQSEIARAITDTLQATLTSQDQANLSSVPTASLEAYQAYLLGKQRMISRASASLEEAAAYFKKAIEIDPDYALAYVGLAETYMLLGDYGGMSLRDMLANAEPALSKALELNDQLVEAYVAKGAIRSKAGDFTESEDAYRRAIELDPNHSRAYHWYGDLLVAHLQRPEAALPLLERAYELDPVSPALIVTLGQALAGLGRFEEAMEFYRKTIEIEPAYPSPYLLIGDLYRFAYGRLDQAVRWSLEGVARDPGYVRSLSTLGFSYLDLGDDARAEHWINRAMSVGPDHYRSNDATVFLYRYRGQEAEALNAARRLQTIAPGNNTSIVTFVTFGRYREALRGATAIYPELSCDREPEVSRFNLFPAINLSLALQETGDRECANRLLDKALERMQIMPRLGLFGYGIADVEVYARLGKKQQALSTLRQAIDQGWRARWWRQGERSPHTVSLRDEPEFQTMMDEIRYDMATQLEHLREMEANGELAVVPEL